MKKITKKNIKEVHSLINDETPFAVKESFSMLRTNILYTRSKGDGAPVFAITSAGESSGKSTVIANLSYAFANTSKKVLLIDGDMRCPVQQEFFGYKKGTAGLSEVLSGIVKDWHDVVVKTDNSFMEVIPSGHIPPNPSELLLGPEFPAIISELKREYDYVFIDFPPIGVIADAVSVANVIDGYIFVVRANISDTVTVNDALANLENVGANIVGIVLNDVNYKDGAFGGKYSGKKYSKYSKYSKYADVETKLDKE